MKKNKNLVGAAVLTAIASSLCCVTPVLALISGTTGAVSAFPWLEPLRPYLIGFTLLVLVFAWDQKLTPSAIGASTEIDCDCETDDLSSEKVKHTSFLHSKLFLGIVTVFAIAMMAFPYYVSAFYPKTATEAVVDVSTIQTLHLEVKGMTCASCEAHINHSVNQLNGILKVASSYEKGSTEVQFDTVKTSISEIKKAVNATGYSVIEPKDK